MSSLREALEQAARHKAGQSVRPKPPKSPKRIIKTRKAREQPLNIDRYIKVAEHFDPHITPPEPPPAPAVSSSSVNFTISVPLVTTPPVEQDATVAVALPPDLEWLNTAGPYTATVASIVGQVRISRTAIALSLEKLNARRASLAADLGTLDAQIAREQATLMHVEETLGSCQLLVENSAKIGSEWLKPSTVKHNGHRATGDIYGSRDLRKFFEANPSTNWTAAEIVATAPLAKRATAKVNVPAGLAALAKEGFLIRIDKGVYRKGSQ